MKKLLLALLLVSGAAQAEVWIMPNTGGGEITLTQEKCRADNGAYPSLRHVYSWTTNFYMEGCWAVIDGNISVIWMNKDGSREKRVYPIASFNKKATY